jgi:hypothetical protein
MSTLTEEILSASRAVEGHRPADHASRVQQCLRQISHDLDPARKHPGRVHLTRGDVAALRRDPASSMAFYRLATVHFEEFLKSRDAEQRWSTLIRAMAILAGLHDSGTRLGQALARARTSEHRLTRLLRAEGEALESQVVATARFLSAKAIGQEMFGFADLLGITHRHEEEVRRWIAGSYYRELSKAEN